MTKSVDLIFKEFEKIKKKPIEKKLFDQYINQFKGQIVLSEENRSQLLHMHCKNILTKNKSEFLDELLNKIDLLTPKKLCDISQNILDKKKTSYLAYVSE